MTTPTATSCSKDLPTEPGWYWFMATLQTPSPTGFLRVGRWVIVLVGTDREATTKEPLLVVRFPQGVYCVDELNGIWSQKLIAPTA